MPNDDDDFKSLFGELPQRVEELWYEDGTLIIEAGGFAFRVYAGILSARSSVFCDMMSIPQPESSASQSCPTVTLHDCPQDLTHFLKAIMDSQYFEPPPHKTNLSVITGVLRLSTKYDVPYLRKRALMHLNRSYPSSLKAWDNRNKSRTIPSITNLPFMLLCLAREVDVPWIMPQLMHCINTRPMTQILEGILWDEVQVKLSEEHKKLLIIGRLELAHLQNSLLLNTLHFENNGCMDPKECFKARSQLLKVGLSINEINALDIFRYKPFRPYKADMCERCSTDWQSRLDFARKAVWKRLPNVFGYSGWAELNQLRASALEITA